jgi:hypothetical protein
MKITHYEKKLKRWDFRMLSVQYVTLKIIYFKFQNFSS